MRASLLFSLLVSASTLNVASAASLRGSVDPLDVQSYRFDVTLDRPGPAAVLCEEAGNAAERHRVRAPTASTHQLVVRGLKADTRYTCRLELRETAGRMPAPVSFRTAPLPPGLVPPKISVAATDVTRTAYTLFNYNHLVDTTAYTYLVVLDAQGNVRWWYRVYKVNAGGGGDLDATWLGNDRIVFGGDKAHNVPPTVVGLDKHIYFTAASEAVSPTDEPTWFTHDAGPSEEGDTLLYINDTDVGGTGSTSTGVRVIGFVIKELDPVSNKVLWYWDSIEDGYKKGVLNDPGAAYSSQAMMPNDPYHANSVEDHWENGKRYLYVGLRNQNEVLKIDYQTKAVVWRLGINRDFKLLEANATAAADSRWFFNPHDAHVLGNRVWLFDNGVDRNQYGGNPYSRVLELELDVTRLTAKIMFEYSQGGWLEAIFGGYDRRDDGYRLIALPHTMSSSSSTVAALIEIDPGGKITWRGDFTESGETLYRADHIDGCDIFNNVTYCPTGP